MKSDSKVRQAVIVGCYEGQVSDSGKSAMRLYAEGALGALRDASLALGSVDGLLTHHSWEAPALMHSVDLADYLGLAPDYTETVSLGGASPCGMVARAARAIESGTCDVIVLASGSNRSSGLGRDEAIDQLRSAADARYEVPHGVFIPALYSLIASRYLHEHGLPEDALSSIALAQRAYAEQNPRAHMQESLALSEYSDSKMISTPLRLFDCCLVTDFSAGLVVASEEVADRLGVDPIYVLGYGENHTHSTLMSAGNLTTFGAKKSASSALKMAGLTIEDMDFAELYDCFTITVAILMEDLGICAPGTATEFVAAGRSGPEGSFPINTNGGMLSYATGGMFHVTEAVAQLRGRATGHQLDGVGTAIVHGVGGILSTNCTVVLSKSGA